MENKSTELLLTIINSFSNILFQLLQLQLQTLKFQTEENLQAHTFKMSILYYIIYVIFDIHFMSIKTYTDRHKAAMLD